MIENAGFNPARQFIKALWDYRNLWLIPMAACTILAVMFALFAPKTYSARQTLVIRDDLAGTAFKPGRFESLESLKSAQETVLEIARRPHVVRRTLEKLGPASGRARKSWPSDQVIESTQGKISINAPNGAELGKTEAIVLSVTAGSKKRASKFIEILLNEIEKNSREFRVHRFQSMEEELQQSATVAKRSYEKSAVKLQDFERRFSMDLGTLRSLNDSLSSKNALVEALAELKRESREAQKQAARIDKQMDVLIQAKSDPTVLLSAPPKELLELQPALAGLTQGLNKAVLRLSKNLGRYSKAHPLVISDGREIKDIKSQISNELGNSISSLQSEHSLRLQNADQLRRRIKDYETRLANLSGNRVGYQKLSEEVKKKQEVLGKAETMLAEIQSLGASAHTVNLLTRIDKPQISYNPIGPTNKTIVFGGMLAGLLMGIGLVMFFAPIDIGEAFPSRPGTMREMATAPGVATAGATAPATMAPAASAPPAPANQHPATPFAAAAAPANASSAFTTPGTIATEPAADQFARALAKSIAAIATNAQVEQASKSSPAEAYSAGSTHTATPNQNGETQSVETQNDVTPSVDTNQGIESSVEAPENSTNDFLQNKVNPTPEPESTQTEIADTATISEEANPVQEANLEQEANLVEEPILSDENLADTENPAETNSIQAAATAESPTPTASIFDKLIGQLGSAKSTLAKMSGNTKPEVAEETDSDTATTDLDDQTSETDALSELSFDTPPAATSNVITPPETPPLFESQIVSGSVSMDSIIPDPFVAEPPQAPETETQNNAIEAAFESLSPKPDDSFAATPVAEQANIDVQEELNSAPTEGVSNVPPSELLNEVTTDELRKLTKSTAEPISDQILEENLSALLDNNSTAEPKKHTDLELANEQNIISGLGLDDRPDTSEINNLLDELKNRRESPLTESRIATKTDSFPQIPYAEAESNNEPATPADSSTGHTREPAETVAPPSIRQKPETQFDFNPDSFQDKPDAADASTDDLSDLLFAKSKNEPATPDDSTSGSTREPAETVAPPSIRQTAETLFAGNPESGDKPKGRQKAKTVDLRDLKKQLSQANLDTEPDQLGRKVAETILASGDEQPGESVDEDLSEKISRLTKSIEDYVQPDD